MKKLDSSHWKGEAATTFREKFQTLPTDWLHAADAFEDAAKALETYSKAITSAQGKAREAIALYKEGDKDTEKAKAEFKKKADAYDAARNSDTPLPHPGTPTDPGKAKRQRAREILNDARKTRNAAADLAKSAVTTAMAHAPKEPTGREKLKLEFQDFQMAQGVEVMHLAGGVVKGAAGLVNFVRTVNPIDPYNLTHPAEYYKGVNMTLAGLASTVANPDRALKNAWDAAKGDPSEFLGRLIPEILGTKGAGVLRGGLRAGMRNGGKHLPDGDKSNGSRGDHEHAPDSNGQRCSETVCKKDPIDIATGRMLLPQTDIALPGSIPLVFRRTFDSSRQSGRWFGPAWSSTVDQRLEIDSEGVIFSCDEGSLLAYPHPAPSVPVMPTHGRRWPLDRVDDGYTITDPDTGKVWHFTDHSDELALLAQIDDRNGRWITLEYDEAGAPTSIVHHGGYHLKLTTSEGRITALHLAGAAADGTDQEILRYGYTDGHLTSVTNSSGLPLLFGYDERGRITSWTDTNGSRFEYVYDELDRCVHQSGASGHLETRFTWDDIDPETGLRITSLMDGKGNTERHLINDRSQVVVEIDALGAVTRFAYDRYNRLLSRTDPLGNVSRSAYDDNGRLTVTERPDGRESRAEYNELGLPVRIVGTDANVTRQTFDERGNRTSVTDAAGRSTRFAYDAAGHLTSVTDSLGHATTVRCDRAGIAVEVTDPQGAVTRYERDAFGRPVAITDPVGATTRLDWSVEGRPLRRIAPDGTAESWTYDGEGNCTAHTDAVGGVTRFEYTHFDLLSARTDPDGARHEFHHDSELRLTQVVNPQGLTWSYQYDPVGRLISETDFDHRTLTYTHDAAGRLASRTNALAQTITWHRDALGQVTRKDADGRITTFTYDLTGGLAQAEGPDGTLMLLRDQYGRMRQETVNGRTSSYTYDKAGRRTGRTTPSGVTTEWTYDAAGRRTGIVTSGRHVDFTYDPAGRELARHFGEAVAMTNTFDAMGRLTSHSITQHGSDRALQQRTYTYRADGALLGVDDQLTGARRFDLDGAGRVTAVHAANWTETYAYDEVGNQTTAGWPVGHPGQAAVGSRDYTGTRITRAGNTRYEYDALGRVVRRRKVRPSRKSDVWQYRWDVEDRLTSVVTPDGTLWQYTYDPLGRRTAKLRLAPDGETVVERVEFTWDGTILCEQTTLSSTLANAVILTWDHQGLHPIAQTERITSADASQEEIDSRFFAIVTDLVGAPSELVDEQGGIAWQTRSTLWGTTAWNRGAAAYTPLRFPGQYYDAETGLHYNYFRQYDPETARYLTPDPLGLAPASNPVTYVHNPHLWSDPWGLGPCPIGGEENHVPLNAARGDVVHPTQEGALREVMRRYDVTDPSVMERTPHWGKNPNLTGPQGEPWETITAFDSKGNIVEIEHHANGHYFKDKEEWALPHYHGPKGEHVYYGDMDSAYGLQGRPRDAE